MGSVLKLDFDWMPPSSWFGRKVNLIRAIFPYSSMLMKDSKRGTHLIVTIEEDLTEQEICMWQWVFGDDQDRARLNYARMSKGVKNWNKLFVRKVKK